jgi:hypothetical protein
MYIYIYLSHWFKTSIHVVASAQVFSTETTNQKLLQMPALLGSRGELHPSVNICLTVYLPITEHCYQSINDVVYQSILSYQSINVVY